MNRTNKRTEIVTQSGGNSISIIYPGMSSRPNHEPKFAPNKALLGQKVITLARRAEMHSMQNCEPTVKFSALLSHFRLLPQATKVKMIKFKRPKIVYAMWPIQGSLGEGIIHYAGLVSSKGLLQLGCYCRNTA